MQKVVRSRREPRIVRCCLKRNLSRFRIGCPHHIACTDVFYRHRASRRQHCRPRYKALITGYAPGNEACDRSGHKTVCRAFQRCLSCAFPASGFNPVLNGSRNRSGRRSYRCADHSAFQGSRCKASDRPCRCSSLPLPPGNTRTCVQSLAPRYALRCSAAKGKQTATSLRIIVSLYSWNSKYTP